MSELKEIMLVNQVSGERTPSGTYKKAEVDAAIAELKARIHELESMPHTDNSAVIELLETENEALKKELAELREANRWRKCIEELPPEGAEVLAYYVVNLHTYNVERTPLNKFVTYWMPLPKSPEVK
ncbi:MAG: hypothetical protein J6U20_03960 [Fibrobacter sp.]|nr:hypothetical protein [Fibrobacter sp.]